MVVASSSLPAEMAAAGRASSDSGQGQSQQNQNQDPSEQLPRQTSPLPSQQQQQQQQGNLKQSPFSSSSLPGSPSPSHSPSSPSPGSPNPAGSSTAAGFATTNSASRLSTSSNSSSLSPLTKARGIFASAARLVQKAPRKVISALTPGKSDGSHSRLSRSKSKSSRRNSLPDSAEMAGASVGVMAPPAASLGTASFAARLSTDSQSFKENASPVVASSAASMASGSCTDDGQSGRPSFSGSTYSLAPLRPLVPLGEAGRPKRSPEEDAVHEAFTQAALEMARLALRTNETPVGCVLVHDGKVIAKGMNATNVTRNGTRHAEFMAVCSLLSQPSEPGADVSFATAAKTARAFHEANQARKAAEAAAAAAAMLSSDSNSDARSISSTSTSLLSVAPSVSSSVQAATRIKVEHEDVLEDDVAKSYLFPYGQKWWPEPKFNPDLFHECTLYVTVEPCVMCASFLRQLGIKKVFFGAVNDKFGGTGGVFNIHKNCQKLDETQLAQGTDGGPVGRGFDVEGGWGRDEAVALLRRFYVQENGRAPVPRKKEGRAARLAALEQVNGITVGEVDAGMLSTLDSNSNSSISSSS